MTEPLLKPETVAKMLSISRPYIYKLVACGMLPAVVWQVPGAGPRRKVVRIRLEDVEGFIAKHYTNH
jgi:excisionase family DNA binding protein